MTIDELEALIGPNALDQLCTFFGGRRIYVPADMHPHHPIALVIGHSAAERLSCYLKGERLSVPKNAQAENKGRDTELVQRYREGESVRYLAAKYQLTERRIYTILQGAGCQSSNRQPQPARSCSTSTR